MNKNFQAGGLQVLIKKRFFRGPFGKSLKISQNLENEAIRKILQFQGVGTKMAGENERQKKRARGYMWGDKI